MPEKRHKPDEIVTKLCPVGVVVAQGKSAPTRIPVLSMTEARG